MYRLAGSARGGAMRLLLSTACSVGLVASAHAQFPGFSFPSITPPSTTAPSQQQKQSVGTVLTVPMSDYGQVVAQNAIRQKNVNLLHLTQVAVGDMNQQVATISIRQRNRNNPTQLEPATQCYLPARSLNWIKQANKNTTIIEQGAVGFGNTQVAQVEVVQTNRIPVNKGTRFVMTPMWATPAIQALNQQNVNVVHVSQLAVGDENSQVALVAVDQRNVNNLKVPANSTGALVQLNMNLNVITQVAVGNNNTQVAQVSVGQDNKL